MVSEVMEISRDSATYPAQLGSFFYKKPPRLWCRGEAVILNGKILGVLSARKIEPDLALQTSRLLREVASLEITFVGGWHSPLEEEALRILLTKPAKVVFCLPKSLNKFAPSAEVKNLIGQGKGLLLTHCSPKAKRISRDASLRRNQLVAGLSTGLLVLSAPVGSASFKLAQLAMNLGRPVFTPQHPINQGLLASGTLPATMENLQKNFP